MAGDVKLERAATQVAADPVSDFQRIENALAPVIGRVGVSALCRRSVHLTSADHPWVLDAMTSSAPTFDFDRLKRVLALHTAAEAAAAGQAMLRHFHALLDSLIGPSLAERLLSPDGGAPDAPANSPQETDS